MTESRRITSVISCIAFTDPAPGPFTLELSARLRPIPTHRISVPTDVCEHERHRDVTREQEKPEDFAGPADRARSRFATYPMQFNARAMTECNSPTKGP